MIHWLQLTNLLKKILPFEKSPTMYVLARAVYGGRMSPDLNVGLKYSWAKKQKLAELILYF